MANRPDLPNLLDIENELDNLKSNHLKLKKDYEAHLSLGFLAGGLAFLFMLMIEVGLFLILKN